MQPEVNVESAVNEILKDLDLLSAEERQLQSDLAHWGNVAEQMRKAFPRDGEARTQGQTPPLLPTHEAPREAARPDKFVMACGHCGKPMSASARFCGNCGKPRSPGMCPRCGEPVKPNAKFCGKCGAAIA